MSATIHESHVGGVLRIMAPAGAWGAVPLKLIQDRRLSLEARGVGVWLATRPDGWQISGAHLLRELNLGRDRWRRIAAELESTKYLLRRSSPSGPHGRWVWEIVFCAIPSGEGGETGCAPAPSPKTKKRGVPPSALRGALEIDQETGLHHDPRNARDIQALVRIREFPGAAVRQAVEACADRDDRGRAFPSAVLRHLRRLTMLDATPAWALAEEDDPLPMVVDVEGDTKWMD